MDIDSFYTLASWKVKPGMNKQFIEKWNQLSIVFSNLEHPPISGTLIQSISDENLYYSFGPWRQKEHIEAMRNDPDSQKAFAELINLCEEATPGTWKLVSEVKL
jgi:hypothetical protein